MKKKTQPVAEPIIPEQLLELAKKSIETDKPVHPSRDCVVCKSPFIPMSGPQQDEDLCWVCRRLKISAWRDVDQQAASPE